MTGQFSCQTKGVVYLTTCEKCHKQSVGQTFRRLYDRVMDHLRYIKNGKNALGEHYKNSKKCDSNRDLKFQIIERIYPNEDLMRLHREKFWIDKLDVKEPNGLNKIGYDNIFLQVICFSVHKNVLPCGDFLYYPIPF